MTRNLLLAASLVAVGAAGQVVKDYVPVTEDMLLHPSPDDWLMYSRTYDAQRFSPLKQVNRSNVGQLRMAWTRGLGPGTSETIPIVHNGVMYLVEPGAIVQALDATNGDLIWEYKRKVPTTAASTAVMAGRRSRNSASALSSRGVWRAISPGRLRWGSAQ